MPTQNVLLIEAEPQVAGAYELFLAARGYVVSAVSTVAAGLRSAAGRPPNVVIIGTLPDSLDAGTVAQRVRAIVSPKPIMVVVLSASVDEVEGADIVIPSGAHPRALMDAVRTAARRRPVTAPLATAS
jgi:two-component system KDP operon response regulator KdpE